MQLNPTLAVVSFPFKKKHIYFTIKLPQNTLQTLLSTSVIKKRGHTNSATCINQLKTWLCNRTQYF